MNTTINTSIQYKINEPVSIEEVIDVFISSGITRPVDDPDRIKQMLANANLIVTAWKDDKLIGISRSITDFCYCCYLSDLAVRIEYQHQGIGKELIDLTRKEVGPESMVLLLAAPQAKAYYPKVGFENIDNAFLIGREK